MLVAVIRIITVVVHVALLLPVPVISFSVRTWCVAPPPCCIPPSRRPLPLPLSSSVRPPRACSLGFLQNQHPSARRSSCCRHHDWSLSLAKLRPTSSFDLQAIEAFEKELLENVITNTQQQDEDEDDEEDDFELEEEDGGNGRVGEELEEEEQYSFENLIVPPELHKKRVDAVLFALNSYNASRSSCGALVDKGRVYLALSGNNNTKKTKIDRKSFRVDAGQVLLVAFWDSGSSDDTIRIVPENIPLKVLYEDEHMIVINKASNMVVHPGAGHRNGTVVNALAYYLRNSSFGPGDIVGGGSGRSEDEKFTLESINTTTTTTLGSNNWSDTTISDRPGLMHRLDKNTTGILIVAKTKVAHAALARSFLKRKVEKYYLAFVVGYIGSGYVVMNKPIGRHPVDRRKMAVVPVATRGRHALTIVKTLKRASSSSTNSTLASSLSFVNVRIITGRQHQIRVHLQDHNTPVYGDPVYGLPDWNQKLYKKHRIQRPLLHAYRVKINHPITGEKMVFTAPLPRDMIEVLRTFYSEKRRHNVINKLFGEGTAGEKKQTKDKTKKKKSNGKVKRNQTKSSQLQSLDSS